VFIGATTDRNVILPGLVIRARKAVGALPGDTPFVGGLHMASRARAYLENIPASRARSSVARRLSRSELEAKLEGDLQDRGEDYLKRIRDDARRERSSSTGTSLSSARRPPTMSSARSAWSL